MRLANRLTPFDQGTDNDPGTGTLTIQLADGSTVSGAVNSSFTKVEVESAGTGTTTGGND